MIEDVVIVGAGPAGLAVAHELVSSGVDPLVLERGPSPATSWRARHDHLRLNTHRRLSNQPRSRMPRRYGAFPHRDDFVAYLTRCADELRIRCDTEVSRIERADHGWDLATDAEVIGARHVVVATGPDARPFRPSWPGEETFTGRLAHAADFHRLADADGKDVLIVGSGNSGVDLLNHLVRRDTGNLWLAARRGTTVVPQRLLGVPLQPIAVATARLPTKAQDTMLRLIQSLAFGDLSRYGYPRAHVGALTRFHADNVAPAVDHGFVRALRAGRVNMKPTLTRIDGARAVFADGSTCEPDIIVAATGYRPGLEHLVGHLVPLDHLGMPPRDGARPAGQSSLWFFGLERRPYGNLSLRRRARGVARAIAESAGPTATPTRARRRVSRVATAPRAPGSGGGRAVGGRHRAER